MNNMHDLSLSCDICAVQMLLCLCLSQVETTRNEGAVQLQWGMLLQCLTVAAHVTPASEAGYKYYYSISHSYHQLWNLTLPFINDLDYIHVLIQLQC